MERPNHSRTQVRVAEFEVLDGEVLTRTGNMQAAIVLLQRAHKRSQAALLRAPADTYVHRELVHSLLQLGDWHIRQKGWSVAGTYFEQMAVEAKKIVERQPGESKAIMDVSTALGRLGDVSQPLKDPNQALKY